MGIMIQFHCVITLFLISTDMCLRTNVPFQYTISGNREQVFLLYYKDFFEQICSDVQFISPPEKVGEFLLHLLNRESYDMSVKRSFFEIPAFCSYYLFTPPQSSFWPRSGGG